MLYNELRAALKPYREAGLTAISFNASKTALETEYNRLTAETIAETETVETETVAETETVENDTPVLRDVTELQTELDVYFNLDSVEPEAAKVDKELYLPIISEIGEMMQGFMLALIVYGQMCQWLMRTTLKGIALGRAWYPIVRDACKVYGLRVLLWYIDMGIDANFQVL